MAQAPYLQLSGFYFFWFATLGAVLPYWGLYLRDSGYSASQIGSLFAALMGTKIVAPYVWGWIADHRGERIGIIRLAAVLTLGVFSLIPYADSFLWMLCFMTVYGFFWNASLPQVEAVTFNYLGDREEHYGRIRLWGSIGFILSVTTLGWLLQRYGLAPLPLWILASLGGVLAISVLLQERSADVTHAHAGGLWQGVRRKEVMALLLACMLMQMSHGPYYTFFSIYLEDHGYSREKIGLLWSLGVIAEIAVFLAMPLLARRIGMRRLFLWAVAITVLRWFLLSGFVDHPVIIVCVQLMHLASFGLYHAVAVNLVHRFFRGRLQGRGQALYSSVSFGVGGGLGSLMSGYLWEWLSPSLNYAVAAVVAALAWGLCLWLLRLEENGQGGSARTVSALS